MPRRAPPRVYDGVMPPRRASTRTSAGALAAVAAATALVACSGGAPGTPDGAADAPADAVADHCGNGVVDPGEVCDEITYAQPLCVTELPE